MYEFTVEDKHCADHVKMIGVRVEVESMNYPGFEMDTTRLEKWCLAILVMS